jgi:hypothetical protein
MSYFTPCRMFSALFCAWEKCQQGSDDADTTCPSLSACIRANHLLSLEELRVTSIGGGPGNDAVGFAVFNAMQIRHRRVRLEVYDFAACWQPMCESIAGALCSGSAAFTQAANAHERSNSSASGQSPQSEEEAADISMVFALADLKEPPDSEVNTQLMNSCPGTVLRTTAAAAVIALPCD